MAEHKHLRGGLTDRRLTPAVWWLLMSSVLVLAITRQSLWIDEGYTAWFASQHTIAAFWSTLIGSPGAAGDPQMFAYLLHVWLWIKIFGSSEFALRAANIPFALLFVVTMGWASERLFGNRWWWIVCCLSPFLWFYMNEARPYVAVMAFSGISVVAELAYLMHRDTYKTIAPWTCLISLIVALGCHILAAFLIPSLVCLFLLTSRKKPIISRIALRDWAIPLVICVPVFLALAAFYAWTASYGVNMAKGTAGIANMAFPFYEFLGFGGIGPPRNELRALAIDALPLLSLWSLGCIAIMSACALVWFGSRRNQLFLDLGISLLLGMIIAFSVARWFQYILLGRHLAAFLPLTMLTGLSRSESRSNGKLRHAAVLGLVIMGLVWSISDIRLVLLHQYEKDDYRAASSMAVRAAEQSSGQILWAADARAAGYYGLGLVNPPSPPAIENVSKQEKTVWPSTSEALDVRNCNFSEARDYTRHLTAPVILVLSKPDLFDQKGAWGELIKQENPSLIVRLNAFEIYEWKPEPSAHNLLSGASLGGPAVLSHVR